MISGDKAPAAAEAGGVETGADAVDGAGATAAEVAAAGAAAGTTSSVGADLGLPSASEAGGLSHGADPAGAEGRPRSPPTRAAPVGTTGAAATTEAPASWRSRVSTRSARASNVTSASGRTIRVSAISKVSRGFVDVTQKPRQAVDAEQRQLLRKLAARRLGHVEYHLGPRHGHNVHVAHMLGQIAHELRQIRTRFHVLRRPAEARGHVARTDCAHDLGQVVRVDGAQ